MYALGSSTPMANTPMASTTRVTSSVMVLMTSRSLPPHPLGSNMLAPYGPEKVSRETGMGGKAWHTYDHAEEKGPDGFSDV